MSQERFICHITHEPGTTNAPSVHHLILIQNYLGYSSKSATRSASPAVILITILYKYHGSIIQAPAQLVYCHLTNVGGISESSCLSNQNTLSVQLCQLKTYPQRWYSEYINPYIPTQTPRKIKVTIWNHQIGDPFYLWLYVCSCDLASKEKSMHDT